MIRSKRQLAYDRIREMIRSGMLPPGARLTEIALSQEIEISRGPLREAINQLASEGVLELAPGLGAYIKSPDREEIIELYELREALESFAAAKAAASIGPESLTEMQRLCEQMRAYVAEFRDTRVWTEQRRLEMLAVDVAFHDIIQRVAGNSRISKIVADCQLLRTVVDYNHSLAKSHDSTLRSKAWTWAYHERILRALRRRDPNAARHWMAAHIQVACRKAVAAFENLKREPSQQ